MIAFYIDVAITNFKGIVRLLLYIIYQTNYN